MSNLPGQPDKRRVMRFTDQHGRKWTGIIEIKTAAPVGPLRPLGWSAPLIVPHQYFVFDPIEPNMMKIDYGRWVADIEAKKRDWTRKLQRNAQRMFAERAGEMLAKPPPALLTATGPKPFPVEPVQAAASGNRFVLGLSPIMPQWAKKFFGDEGIVTKINESRLKLHRQSAVMDEWADEYPDAEEEQDEVLLNQAGEEIDGDTEVPLTEDEVVFG